MAILHDLVLDCLYKLHCRKLKNHEIRRELELRHMPPMTDEQIAMFRKQFEWKESVYPREMRGIRDRLKVKQ